jgi:hypothetical protein
MSQLEQFCLSVCSEMLITRTSRLAQRASYSHLLRRPVRSGPVRSGPARQPVSVFTGLYTGFIRPIGQTTNHSTKQTEISGRKPIKFQKDIKSQYTVRPLYRFSEDGGCHSVSRTQPSYGIQAPSSANGNTKRPV